MLKILPCLASDELAASHYRDLYIPPEAPLPAPRPTHPPLASPDRGISYSSASTGCWSLPGLTDIPPWSWAPGVVAPLATTSSAPRLTFEMHWKLNLWVHFLRWCLPSPIGHRSAGHWGLFVRFSFDALTFWHIHRVWNWC
jgi:hypothetical protein